MKKTEIYNIPQTEEERHRLRALIEGFVRDEQVTPPVSMDLISKLSEAFISANSLDEGIKAWVMVEINNSAWMDTVASVPYERRILLLPKCLSNSAKCKADYDELGLLCNLCDNCSIPDLQDKAESLGMMSIVAEGFTSVIGLVKNKVVDSVIGVSCLDSLEQAFPLLINNAVPGLAVPLNMDGCKDTTVDQAYVERLMTMKKDQGLNFLEYDRLKTTIKDWFSQDNLTLLLGNSNDLTSRIAREWISDDGKRWRPYLLAATYMALSGKNEIPMEVQKAAVAVECFHKASLVHDDIQDNDTTRYGKQTVYAAHGVPMAINVGDLYLGEGYRLLADNGKMELLRVAADAHIALCKGQGMELEWCQHPTPLDMASVLEIFKNKTIPAFDVSLMMGVICAGDNKELRRLLNRYSNALGIAYQLQDDLEDFENELPLSIRPSAILAVICQQNNDTNFIERLLCSEDVKTFLNVDGHQQKLEKAVEEVKKMQESYHQEALNVLNEVKNTELKMLLFRLTKKMLN